MPFSVAFFDQLNDNEVGRFLNQLSKSAQVNYINHRYRNYLMVIINKTLANSPKIPLENEDIYNEFLAQLNKIIALYNSEYPSTFKIYLSCSLKNMIFAHINFWTRKKRNTPLLSPQNEEHFDVPDPSWEQNLNNMISKIDIYNFSKHIKNSSKKILSKISANNIYFNMDLMTSTKQKALRSSLLKMFSAFMN